MTCKPFLYILCQMSKIKVNWCLITSSLHPNWRAVESGLRDKLPNSPAALCLGCRAPWCYAVDRIRPSVPRWLQCLPSLYPGICMRALKGHGRHFWMMPQNNKPWHVTLWHILQVTLFFVTRCSVRGGVTAAYLVPLPLCRCRQEAAHLASALCLCLHQFVLGTPALAGNSD